MTKKYVCQAFEILRFGNRCGNLIKSLDKTDEDVKSSLAVLINIVTSLLLKVTNNDCDMLNIISKRVLKIVSNYNYYSINNIHTLLREPSFYRYNESDNKNLTIDFKNYSPFGSCHYTGKRWKIIIGWNLRN